MKRVLIVAASMLVFAVPAASARDYTIVGGGWVVDRMDTGSLAQFRINLKAGPTHKLTYTDGAVGTVFYSLRMTKLTFTTSAVKIRGLGMANGKRVAFTAIAVDRPGSADTFQIAWNHGAARGGTVFDGNIRVQQLKLG